MYDFATWLDNFQINIILPAAKQELMFAQEGENCTYLNQLNVN